MPEFASIYTEFSSRHDTITEHREYNVFFQVFEPFEDMKGKYKLTKTESFLMTHAATAFESVIILGNGNSLRFKEGKGQFLEVEGKSYFDAEIARDIWKRLSDEQDFIEEKI